MADEANPHGMKRPKSPALPSQTKSPVLPSQTKSDDAPPHGIPRPSELTIDSRVDSSRSGVDVSKNRTLAMRKAYVNSEIRKHTTMPSIHGRNFRTRKHGEVDS